MAKKRTTVRRRQPAPRRTRVSARPTASTALVNRAATGVCSVTDPFCQHAEGAKWQSPAASDAPSIPYIAKGIVPIVTGNTGSNYIVFVPTVAEYVGGGAKVDVEPVTYPAVGALVDDGTLSTGLSSTIHGNAPMKARIVNAGFRVWDAAPATSAGGYLLMHQIDYGDWATDTYASTVIHNTDPNMLLDRRKGGHFIAQRVNAEADQFTAVTSTPKNAETTGWSNCVVVCTGEPNITVAYMEWVIHFEIVPHLGTTLSRGTHAGRVPRPIAQAVTEMAASSYGMGAASTVEDIGRTLRNKAVAWIKGHLLEYAPALAAAYGGPAAGAMTSMLLTNG